MKSDRERFRELLKSFDTAMLVTHRHDPERPLSGDRYGAHLHVRPMAIADVTDGFELWFLTSRATPKVDEVERDHHAQVICQTPECFLTCSGVARVVADREKIAALWKPMFKAWFPRGKEDPEIVLIAVQAEEGEYWDRHGVSRLKYLARAVKSLVTGARLEVDRQEHAKARLTPPRP